MLEECQKCRAKMVRVGIAQPTEQGVLASFECPICHARVQRLVPSPEPRFR